MTEQPTNYFVRNIKFILKEHGPIVSTFLAFLIDQDELRKNTRKKYNGEFYVSRGLVAEETQIKRKAQMSCEKRLKEAGYIIVVTEKHNANKYTIQYDAINEANPLYTALEDAPSESGDLPQAGSPALPEEAPAPSSNRDRVPTQEGVNYNRTRSSTKKVSISTPTYVPDGIDAFYQELGLGSINKKNSCTKNKSSASPPRAHAQSGTDYDEALSIINEYNSAMDIHFTPGDRELTTTLENLEDLRKVRKYFNSDILNKVWNQYGDEYTNKLEHRRISAFVKCKLLEKLKSHYKSLSKTNDDEIDRLLDTVFLKYGNQISSVIESQGYMNVYGSLEPFDATIHFPPKAHRELRLNLYRKHIKTLLPLEEKDDMMKLEVNL